MAVSGWFATVHSATNKYISESLIIGIFCGKEEVVSGKNLINLPKLNHLA